MRDFWAMHFVGITASIVALGFLLAGVAVPHQWRVLSDLAGVVAILGVGTDLAVNILVRLE